MCGINGILYFNSYMSGEDSRSLSGIISKMNSEISHRGPDGEGSYINYPVCFGHRRLSIIDLSENASQPMFNEDKTVVIVYNGEIYNYRELITDLKNKGHVFRSKSDTEVIIHSYEEYGTECVRKFNGMWAFAIYDFKKNIFFASRDRFGVKPFYYYTDNKCLIFSSEIKAVLKAKNISEANHGKVFDYLAYGYKTNNGDTFFSNINELKPSHSIVRDNSQLKILKYFDLNEVSETGINYKDASDNLKNLLEDSVRIRFRSDVPVSILLSGGLDSGIIASITNSLIEKHEITEPDVSSFSAVFPGFKYDESVYIKEISNNCNRINSYLLTPDFNHLRDTIDNFVYGMGEPVFSTTSFAHYMLMKEIRSRNIKVILNGQGADEAWCGYGRYITGYYLSDLLLKNPGLFIGEFRDVSDKMKFSYTFVLLQLMKSFLSRRTGSYLRSAYGEKIFNCLTTDFRKNNSGYFKNPEYGVLSANKLAEFMKYNIQYQGFNQILHYEDHSAMQNSVEIRSPFTDYRLMTLAFSLPVNYKFENGITKKILRELFKKRLPDSVINNHIKTGFMTPFDDWLNSASGNIFANEIFNSESFKKTSVWDSEKIKRKFKEKNRHPDFPFWRIINTVLWKNAYGITNL